MVPRSDVLPRLFEFNYSFETASLTYRLADKVDDFNYCTYFARVNIKVLTYPDQFDGFVEIADALTLPATEETEEI